MIEVVTCQMTVGNVVPVGNPYLALVGVIVVTKNGKNWTIS